ncbi:hypothetical protein HK099_003621 [Clydaea vesicula]|uniref:ABC transporter domain-containing protein n=1 Tax=Clydaea vesicula TaxID=447962 RepID=A0AAD5U751_9FUNG|nr:hypothetical protein HK099_003621 [Clydaea vesicula]
MGNNNYFKAINLDTRLGNTADQLITTDVKRFCDALASLYSNLGKPVLDIVIFNYQLVRNIGSRGMYGILASYIVTATIMKAITPPFGKLAAEEARLEGNFRIAHSRLITNAEEIAFYNGSEMEKTILDRTYSQLIKHINHIYKIRIAYNMFEDFLIKYSWSAVGLIMASIPVFFPEYAGSAQIEREKILDKNNAGSDILDLKQGSRTQGFITNKRLMVGLADAGGRLMYSYKELSELAGFTFRVYSMIQVLEDINEQKFVQTSGMKPEGEEVFDINKIEGVTEYGHEGLHFKNIPIVTPSGDTVLVKDLNVDINPGDHIMVTGPNGSGKTSILRVISGLWPVFRGVLKRPSIGINEIMYIPQRPYLSIGTLRDQIIYPHNFEDFQKSGRTDKELFSILKTVYLDYIPEREGGMNAVKVWKDVFSGGEKQRIQMARLFYHHPRYVVLDEATSAVSPDVEALMYGSAQDEGITIITISHRPSLFKYHTLLLKVGEGEKGKNWILESISSSNTLIESVDTEIKKIEGHLSDVAELKERLNEINRELKLNVPLVGNDDDDKELKHAKRTLI